MLPLMAWAQTSTTAAIVGTVTDKSGAVVSGAQITLTEVSTNLSRTTNSNTVGQYSIVSILPGTYTLKVEMQGFRQAVRSDIKVDVAKSYVLDISLEVGAIAETVEVVSTGVAELQTLDATVGAVMKGDLLVRLAAGNRSAATLLTLQPMVAPTRGVGTAVGGQVAGARSDQNQFNLDGADATDLTSGTAGYFSSAIDSAGPTPTVPVPIESVEEFRVSTTNPNASFGRSAGGQVSLVTKRGSNAIHGTAYWYHQNDNLNANTWTSNRLGIKKPELKDNRFGVSLGGPVIKDKTFIFGHYEGRRLPRGVLDQHVVVPSETLKQGILRFRDDAGNVVSYNIRNFDPRGRGLSPVVSALWAKFPVGNDPGRGDGLNTVGFTGITDATQRMDFGVVRLDHNFTSNWRLNTTYRYSKQSVADTTQVDIAGLTGGQSGQHRTTGVIPVEPRFWSAQLSGTLTPTMINELNLGYTRGFWSYRRLRAFPQVPGTSAAIMPGFTGAGLHAGIDIDTQRGRSRTWRDQTYQLGDNFTWSRGKHTLQFGASIRHMDVFHERDDKVIGSLTSLIYEVDAFNRTTITAAARPPACGGGVTTNCLRAADSGRYNALFAASLGIVDKAGVVLVRDPNLNNLPIGTPMLIYATFNNYEFYAQDIWRVSPSLTVTAGLTYTIQTPPVDKNKLQTLMIDAGSGQNIEIDRFYQQRIQASQAGQVYNPTFAFQPIANAKDKYIYDIDMNNFGPRVAMAWNPSFSGGWLGSLLGNRKTVVRAGYGVTFDRTNGVGVVMLPVMGAGFTQTVTCFGPRSDSTCAGQNNESNAFRIGVDGATVPLPATPRVTAPVVPPVGGEALSFSIDPKMKIGKSHSVDLTVQRELPGGFLVEAGYVARISNNLPQNFELNSVPYFHKDAASGQTFAQAYDAVAGQLRAGTTAANVTPQPWFENQLRGVAACGASCTRYLAGARTANFTQGALNPLFNAIVSLREGLQAGSGYYGSNQIQNLHVRGSGGESFYNAGFINVTKRFSRSLSFNASYTLSKTFDEYGLNQENIGQASTPYDLSADWGPAIFDRRHVFAGGYYYQLPFGRGQRWNLNGPADKIFGGWYISGILSANSGLPLGIGQSGQTYGGAQLYTGLAAGMHPTGSGTDYSTTVNGGATGSAGIGTNAATATGSKLNIFANPETVYRSVRYIQLSSDGRHRRDLLRGLNRWNFDFSVGKKTSIGERLSVVFSADFLNLTNRVEFSDPSTSYLNPAAFGVITGQFNRPREIQMGLRIEF